MHALGHRADPDQVRSLRSLLNEKERVSYSGDCYTRDEGSVVLFDANAFITWAEAIFERRPT